MAKKSEVKVGDKVYHASLTPVEGRLKIKSVAGTPWVVAELPTRGNVRVCMGKHGVNWVSMRSIVTEKEALEFAKTLEIA
jgi:hypothetical protein